MAGKANLQHAQKAKQDEFYTQLTDIEKELRHYKDHFKGKTVFCNCDDPFESNFFKYFAMNFNFLGLKKLFATCYDTVNDYSNTINRTINKVKTGQWTMVKNLSSGSISISVSQRSFLPPRLSRPL